MRFPSLRQAAAAARATAARFPIVLLSGGTAAVAALALIDGGTDDAFWIRLLPTATLGLPLFTGLTLWSESNGWRGNHAAGVSAAGALGLSLFFVLWPTWSEPVRALRYIQLSFALHLLVAFLPYARRDELNGFWQYNRLLFERFLTAAAYAIVLYLGLVVALLGVDNLLGVDIAEETYLRLWVIVAFVFNPWFFAAGVPRDFAALERDRFYPERLKAFMQFVLVPLVTIYLVILTLYLGRIVVIRQWPSGWIGYLVSSVTVVGILSLLLVHPVAERQDNKWVATYARWFYVALIPSIVMVLLAIWKRVAQYGVTEERYFLVVLSLWLAGIAGFYGWTRSRNIKLIPITLCALVLATFVGPWGAYGWSERSQVNRLRDILDRNEMLVDGRIRPAAVALGEEDAREVSAVLRYLIRTHGIGAISRWFPEPETDQQRAALESGPSKNPEERVEALTALIEVPYVTAYASRGGSGTGFYAARDSVRAVPIGEFDYLLDPSRVLRDTIAVGDAVAYRVAAAAEVRVALGADTVRLSLEPAVRLAQGRQHRRAPVVIEGASGRLRARLIVTRLYGMQRAITFDPSELQGYLLVAVER